MVKDVPEQANQAIIALQKGDKAKAWEMLQQLVNQQPHDERFWLWLSWAARNEQERRECLSRMLAINPNNAAARKWLAGEIPLVSTPREFSSPVALNAPPSSQATPPPFPTPVTRLTHPETPAPVGSARMGSEHPSDENTGSARMDSEHPSDENTGNAGMGSEHPSGENTGSGHKESSSEPATHTRSYLDIPEETGRAPLAPRHALSHSPKPWQDDHNTKRDDQHDPGVERDDEAWLVQGGGMEEREAALGRRLYTISLAIPELDDLTNIRNLTNPVVLLFFGFVLVFVAFFTSILQITRPSTPPDHPVSVATVLPEATVYAPDQEVRLGGVRWRLLAATNDPVTSDGNIPATVDGHLVRVVMEVENLSRRPLIFRSPLLRDVYGRIFEVVSDYGMLSRIAPAHQCEQRMLMPTELGTCELLYHVPALPGRISSGQGKGDQSGYSADRGRSLRTLMIQVDDQIPMTKDEAWIWLATEE